MNRSLKREIYETGFNSYETRFDRNVENFKRRRALPPLTVLNGHARFFDRILSVKKMPEFVFITKTAARSR